jgi:hypothetical protein
MIATLSDRITLQRSWISFLNERKVDPKGKIDLSIESYEVHIEA